MILSHRQINSLLILPAREREDQALLDLIRIAVTAHASREAVTRGSGHDQRADGVGDRHSCGRGTALAPFLDQGTSAGRNL